MAIQVTCPSCQGKFNAPDNAAGKRAKCPTCGSAIQIPTPAPVEEILEAEALPASPYSDEDFEVEAPAALPATPDTKPCPMCGETIQKSALKCRHCGEIFDPLLRAQTKKSVASSDSDADLTTGDWVLCIICSGIGCIMGIIYIIQGKPKGTKMLLISLAMQFVWGAVRVALELAAQ
jgi:predicted RNA-binding Zn-ribbon protein involved in translation (DUF1610 family)